MTGMIIMQGCKVWTEIEDSMDKVVNGDDWSLLFNRHTFMVAKKPYLGIMIMVQGKHANPRKVGS